MGKRSATLTDTDESGSEEEVLVKVNEFFSVKEMKRKPSKRTVAKLPPHPDTLGDKQKKPEIRAPVPSHPVTLGPSHVRNVSSVKQMMAEREKRQKVTKLPPSPDFLTAMGKETTVEENAKLGEEIRARWREVDAFAADKSGEVAHFYLIPFDAAIPPIINDYNGKSDNYETKNGAIGRITVRASDPEAVRRLLYLELDSRDYTYAKFSEATILIDVKDEYYYAMHKPNVNSSKPDPPNRLATLITEKCTGKPGFQSDMRGDCVFVRVSNKDGNYLSVDEAAFLRIVHDALS